MMKLLFKQKLKNLLQKIINKLNIIITFINKGGNNVFILTINITTFFPYLCVFLTFFVHFVRKQYKNMYILYEKC